MFAFTLEDKHLSLSVGVRDPLGTQVVWQQRARDLVAGLTAGSTQPEGFQLLLTALSWWPEFQARHGFADGERKRYFLLVEQAFARACRMSNVIDWTLPGTRRLNAGADGVWIGLDERDLLLDSPLANGVWGIYRGPCASVGLLDSDDRVPAPLAEETRQHTGAMKAIFPDLKKALDASRGARVEIASTGRGAKAEGLVGILRGLSLRRCLKKAFVEPGTPAITRSLSALASMPAVEGAQQIVRRARAELTGPEREVIERVIHCERFLALVEPAFEGLCAEAGSGARTPWRCLGRWIDPLRQAQPGFKTSGIYAGSALARHQALCDLPLESPKALALGLQAMHAGIAAQRRSAPWLEVDGEAWRCRQAVDAPDPSPALQPWRNSYYLDALQAMTRGLSRKHER